MHWLESLRLDLRYAWRLLRRTPGFTFVVVLTLALGVGASTAIFSLIDTVMLRRLPVREPQRLVELLSRYPGEPRVNGFPWVVYEHFRDANHAFSDLLGLSRARFRVSGDNREAETVDGEYVTGNFFEALGVRPAVGRLIGPPDDSMNTRTAAVAVVSWSYWQRRFNGDPATLGRQIVVDNVPATIIGVAPHDFFGLQVGSRPDVWVPAALEPLIQRPSRRIDGTLGLKLMGRLKPSVSIEQARAEMRVLDQWRVEYLARTRKAPLLRRFGIEVEPAGAGFAALRDHFAAPLLVLMAVAGLLLLLACANVASMLLARGAARQRELSVRVALGASRPQIVRQVLAESLLLSAAGSLLGAVFASVGTAVFVRTVNSGRPFVGFSSKLELQTQPDVAVLLFTIGIALSTGVLFGLAPAWSALAVARKSSLREWGVIGETRSARLFGNGLVVAQVALSMVLLSAAGLFVRHLSDLRTMNVGFNHESVLLVGLDLAHSGYDRPELSRLHQELLARLETIPGVRSATVSALTPVEGPGASRFVNVEGFTATPNARPYVVLNWVAPRYFETLGTPWIAGRDFASEDVGRSRVAIVNQAMARYYFGDSSPVGRHFSFDGQTERYEIIGLVGDSKYLDIHEAPMRIIYLHAFQEDRWRQLALRTTVPPSSIVADVRRTTRDVLKTVEVTTVTTLDDQVNASVVPERLMATSAAAFGSIGALVAAFGLYGLLTYTVARRTSEIGVRMALGATERDIVGMVLKGALGLVCAGLLAGAPIAVWSRWLAQAVVAAVAASVAESPVAVPMDAVLPFAFAALMMTGVGLMASYVPARRAARVNPVETLRQ